MCMKCVHYEGVLQANAEKLVNIFHTLPAFFKMENIDLDIENITSVLTSP